MRYALSLLLSLILVLFCTNAVADDIVLPTIPAIPDGKDVHQYLKKGDAAPFEGYLFDVPTSTRWGNWLVLWQQRYQIDMTQQLRIHATEINLRDEKLKILQVQYDMVTKDYQAQLARLRNEAENPPWFRTTWFGVGVGVAGTMIVTSLSIWAIHEVAK